MGDVVRHPPPSPRVCPCAVLIPNAVAERAAAWSAGSPSLPNLVQLAQSVPSLSTLVTAVVAGGLVPTLSK